MYHCSWLTGDSFRDGLFTKHLVWLFFRHSSLKEDSPGGTHDHIHMLLAKDVIFSCFWLKLIASNYSWLELLHPTTLGWKHIHINRISSFSWLKLIYANNVFIFSWLKPLHSTALDWKYRIELLLVEAIAFGCSWMEAKLCKYSIQLLLDETNIWKNNVFKRSWPKISHSITLGWSYCIWPLLARSKTMQI